MRRFKILVNRGVLFCCLTTFLSFGCALGQDATSDPSSKNSANASEAKSTELMPKSRSLFDGDSMSHWIVPVFGGDGQVNIIDKTILITAGDPLTGITNDLDELPTMNYEIELEAKRVDGNDFFCCLTFPVNDENCSLVVGGWAGTVVGISNIDDQDASNNETTTRRKFEPNQWYKIKVRVNESRIQCWIDDEQVVDADTKNKKLSVHNAVRLNRPLGLCSFQTKAAFRNIILRENVGSDGNTIEAK